MPTPHASAAQTYSAVIDHVQEVLLYGSADLAYWQDHLAPVGLAPTPYADRAALVLAAPALRWANLPFCELTLGVFVGQASSGTPSSELYLASAYNSSRLLTWLERQLFQTPYTHRAIAVTATNPATIIPDEWHLRTAAHHARSRTYRSPPPGKR
ncbi:MAG: hypothetical protein AB4911_04390 [Oscillochloridaceae bacterium umkhey_bin13]